MTSQELYDNFLLQYDVNGSSSAVGFTDDEIYMFLTKGQLMMMDSVGQRSSGAELSELNSSLTSSNFAHSGRYNAPNIYTSYPNIDNVYKFINGSMAVKREGLLTTNGQSEIVPIKEIDEALISNLFVSKFNKPIYEWVYIFFVDGIPTYVHDAYVVTLDTAFISYIRLPLDITDTQTSELNEKYHKQVFDAAVSVAMNTTRDARVASKQKE